MTAEGEQARRRGHSSAGRARADVLVAGRVGRAHGLDGSFYVTAPLTRLLHMGAILTLADGSAAAVVRLAGTEERPIVRLQGIVDRAAAAALKGQPLTVGRAALPALAPGEWWAHELEGCAVCDGARQLGTVSRLIELPSCEALEVQRAEGGEPLLVPMVKEAIRSVEPRLGRIEVNVEFLDESTRPPRDGHAPRRAGARATRGGGRGRGA